MEERPKVGIGLLLVKDNKILLGKRMNAHGSGEYASVGGHLEHSETFEDCILREMAEEAGPDLKVKNLRFLCITNLQKYAPKHYIDIGMVADWESGEPRLMEPEKLEGWDWYDIDNLPVPLFGVMDNYLEALRTGTVYYNS